ncbi:sigma-70 family RNA polymerase sigma factor [Maribellus comscasis]|uniref:Sigma-70 family RNA polymerase sigma factor n=1 Tax=Maribellus comscasis TaxID=2681766 RepID=A0A6I6JPK5_9BACT|nr:sigma-70 family RNA polymerase sigma factor [Maribellus comscasis]QGY44905.1 sigma-70 family RNA polymerase sigma factor [Maribellus comscasis]
MKEQKPNKKTFSELIEKNQGLIHKITLVYVDNPADREDLFQEICLQLWKSYPNFRGKSKFSTWMYRVALNTAISNIRKMKSSIAFESIKEYKQIPADFAEDNEDVLQLYRAIGQLNRIDKAIILLWLEEKSYDEIASITGLTKSNVSVKLMRIKKKLEEIVNQTVKQES